ncbi:XdhC family protein [Vallitalea okinawensis]|uniref:XdhC family protein n=1 Tax=Vallitalea okinawensis TaxID=2078660 RepID=UPI00241E93E9|nr:XdhC/CoxI family protein [Vallitalea okinawensis]
MKNSGGPCMVVTVVEKTGDGPVEVGKKMLVGENGEAFGTVGGGALEYFAREKCKELLKKRQSIFEKYLLNEGKIVEQATTLPMACGGMVSLFYEYIGVKAHIYIFGAGHVGQALTRVLKTMDFHVTVIDSRKKVYEAFVGADRKVHASYAEFIDQEGLREGSYVVVCTPSHKHDYNVINKVLELQLEPRYIGMLCSPVKLKDFLEKTYDNFGKDVDLSNFYSPIGLDTGGGTPEEIAISITAEILAVYHNKTGHKHMKDGV